MQFRAARMGRLVTNANLLLTLWMHAWDGSQNYRNLSVLSEGESPWRCPPRAW
jgi:hypothetical protein